MECAPLSTARIRSKGPRAIVDNLIRTASPDAPLTESASCLLPQTHALSLPNELFSIVGELLRGDLSPGDDLLRVPPPHSLPALAPAPAPARSSLSHPAAASSSGPGHGESGGSSPDHGKSGGSGPGHGRSAEAVVADDDSALGQKKLGTSIVKVEDKQQLSPMSILDFPFDDDDGEEWSDAGTCSSPAFQFHRCTPLAHGRVHRKFVPIGKILKPALNEHVTPLACYWSFGLSSK